MNDQLNLTAIQALTAFQTQNYSELERLGSNIYNFFVHNPGDILNLENPLLVGKVFHVCLGFQEPDEDIQEVRAENAFICFSQVLESSNCAIHDEACARLMMLLIREQRHLVGKVEQACRNENASPYDFFAILDDGLPGDMPMAANTKMLFTAYYLYNSIKDKNGVCNRFVDPNEINIFEEVRSHIIENCQLLTNTTSDRKIELGQIVLEKICDRLRKDIQLYMDSMN